MVQETKAERRARKAAAIANDQAGTPEGDTARVIANELESKGRAERIRQVAEAKKAADAKPEPKDDDAKPEPATDGKVSIADVAKGMGVDAKLARAKLRRLAAKGELPEGLSCVDGRWTRVTVGDRLHVFLMATFAPMQPKVE